MIPETRRLKLWRCGQSEKAQQFFVLPPGTDGNRSVWIPRSVIHHLSTLPCEAGKPQPCLVEVEDWFAEKEDL